MGTISLCRFSFQTFQYKYRIANTQFEISENVSRYLKQYYNIIPGPVEAEKEKDINPPESSLPPSSPLLPSLSSEGSVSLSDNISLSDLDNVVVKTTHCSTCRYPFDISSVPVNCFHCNASVCPVLSCAVLITSANCVTSSSR